MTTIIMKDESDGISIAYDSQTTAGHRIENAIDPKVFRNGELILGIAGSAAFANAVKFQKFQEVGANPERWAMTYFAPKLKKIARKLCKDDDDAEISYNVLVIADGVTFIIDDDSSVTRTTAGYHSIGSGSVFALGALSAGSTATEALEIAASLDIYTGGDLHSTTSAELLDAPATTGVQL